MVYILQVTWHLKLTEAIGDGDILIISDRILNHYFKLVSIKCTLSWQ